jgi:hypothetical protein
VVGYNVQVAVDTEHHLIVTHEVTNVGSDRAQLANVASQAKEVLGVDKLEAVADRGYFSGEEILACDKAGITRSAVCRLDHSRRKFGPTVVRATKQQARMKHFMSIGFSSLR